MNPRIWLYYVFDQNACIAYQTAEACNWAPTQLYAYEGADTSQIDAWLIGQLGDGNVLRALYNPDTGQVDAWAQPTLAPPRRYEIAPQQRRYAYWQGQAGIDGGGSDQGHDGQWGY
jgi:hypothetical protein